MICHDIHTIHTKLQNKTIRWQTLARYDAPFTSLCIYRHNARLTSWRVLVSYLVLPRYGEESFNKFLSPNLDLGGGLSHGYTPSCVKKSSRSEQKFFLVTHVDRQIDQPKCTTFRERRQKYRQNDVGSTKLATIVNTTSHYARFPRSCQTNTTQYK